MTKSPTVLVVARYHDAEEAGRIVECLGRQTYRDTKLVFVSRPGEPAIEIICDIDDTGPTRNLIARSGNGFYHVCYEVDDIEASIQDLRKLGFMLRHAPVPATAFNGRKIAWIYNRSIGLVELLEK